MLLRALRRDKASLSGSRRRRIRAATSPGILRALHHAGRCVGLWRVRARVPRGDPARALEPKVAQSVATSFDYIVSDDPSVPAPIGAYAPTTPRTSSCERAQDRSEGLAGLAANLIGAGTRVIAPAKAPGQGPEPAVDYRLIADAAEMALGQEMLPRRSLKEFFLPATEVLVTWIRKKGDIEIRSTSAKFAPQVILGARPCDAAASRCSIM